MNKLTQIITMPIHECGRSCIKDNIDEHSSLTSILFLSLSSPELVHTISIGWHEAIKFSQASLILTKFSKDIPEVISYSLREKALESSEDISSILWQFNPAIRKSPVITITSMLPLDLEHIIQGYCELPISQAFNCLMDPYSGRIFAPIFSGADGSQV
jgi:hypothetical protein